MSFAEKILAVFREPTPEFARLDPAWTVAELLSQDACFALTEVGPKLGVSAIGISQRVNEAYTRGEDPWISMGLRQNWKGWYLQMRLFAPVYRATLAPNVTEVLPSWDGNQLLAQRGTFLLSQVCQKIPFNERQIRLQIRITPGAREASGVWLDPDRDIYFVEMGRFSEWIKAAWLGEASGPSKEGAWCERGLAGGTGTSQEGKDD